MRLGNFNVIMRALREGNVSWLWRQGGKYAAIQIASRTLTEPLTGPLMGTLVTTYRCNERCLVCDLPFRAESSDREELTTATWCRIRG